jgi:hypothetical protein
MIKIVPVVGAWVCRQNEPSEIGFVIAVEDVPENPAIEVDFGPKGRARLKFGEWGCGLRPDFVVQDIPASASRKSMGAGTVRRIRTLAKREQALVQLHDTGRTFWLPFENLRRIKDPRNSYVRREAQTSDAAERLALNIMARALKGWNDATGALDRLDVDPLPDQIALVYRILTSGQLNWLIADDVGLGKTIEVGLLLAALQRRQVLRRILIVVPSGLTKQWKEEMLLKFDRTFSIYGVDFRVSTPREWGIYEQVIVSLDFAKPRSPSDDGTDVTTTFGMLLASGVWDIVIFDEAHRLSRDEAGRTTLRFRLAQKLREKTDALLLLTGTPHQGDAGKFRNLLALVRPDLSSAIRNFDEGPNIVREIVIRNRKIDAVDAEGLFLFQGITVHRVEIERSEDLVILERQLGAYLRRGYRAGDQRGDSVGRAIGFVMTIYRKLASSSVAAIGVALRNRLDRLRNRDSKSNPQEIRIDEQVDDEQNVSEFAEGDDELGNETIEPSNTSFFAEELSLLVTLIEQCALCLRNDTKISELINIVREVVHVQNKKIVIFTEFRTTQAYLFMQLAEQLGIDAQVINGSQTVDEKRLAVERFDGYYQVIISTEAGAEGLNCNYPPLATRGEL